MFFSSKNKIVAPVKGKYVPLKEVNDPVFSQGMMGGGVAVIPREEKIVSPVDGVISMVADQKHGIGIKMNDGTEILMHMGIDTVELKGAPFKIHKTVGDSVKQGDLLAEMDLDSIEEAGKETVIMIITTGKEVSKIKHRQSVDVQCLDELAKI